MKEVNHIAENVIILKNHINLMRTKQLIRKSHQMPFGAQPSTFSSFSQGLLDQLM